MESTTVGARPTVVEAAEGRLHISGWDGGKHFHTAKLSPIRDVPNEHGLFGNLEQAVNAIPTHISLYILVFSS